MIGNGDPDQVAENEITFDAMSAADLAELLTAIELELGKRGWRPKRVWSQPAQPIEVEQ